MTVDISVSSISRASPGYIASADEALDIVTATQFALTDQIRSSLSDNLSTGSNLIEKISSLIGLMDRLKLTSGGPFNPVNSVSLKSTPRTREDLADLFLNAGPRLGNTVAEGQGILDDLLGLGANVQVSVVFPFLTEIRAENGELTSSVFEWLTEEQINDRLKGDLTSVESDFPGADAKSEKAGSSVITFTTFNAYSVLRPDIATLNLAYAQVGGLVEKSRNELLIMVANASKSAIQLDAMISRFKETRGIEEEKRSEVTEKIKAELVDLLRRIRLLRFEKSINEDKYENTLIEKVLVKEKINIPFNENKSTQEKK